MKLTIITQENVSYFIGVLAHWWDAQTANMLFVGLIDDEDAAVGALAVELEDGFARLKHIAIDPQKRRRGYGTFLLRGLIDILQTNKVSLLHSILYLQQESRLQNSGFSRLEDLLISPPSCCDEQERQVVSFFEKNGFGFYDLNLRRTTYRLGDIGEIRVGIVGNSIKSYAELTMEQLVNVAAKIREMETEIPLLNESLYSDPNDRYSRYWVQGERVAAMVHVTPEQDGVRLDSIYADNSHARCLMSLYGAVLAAVRAEHDAELPVQIDVIGQRLLDYQNKKLACQPINSRSGYAAIYRF